MNLALQTTIMKILISCLIFSIAASAGAPMAWAVKRPFRVVIDPGHGGQDEGAVFDNGKLRVAEKDITLALAHQAARELKSRGIEVILTRESDYEVSLAGRTVIANRLKADAFLSIHMNSTETPMVSDAQGVETFILNNTSDASSRRLAQLENSIVSPTVDVDTPQAMDVALILKDLRLDANIAESKNLACALQYKLLDATTGSRRFYQQRDRGVKQALFHVLLGADMPSVLVEAGFITSEKDRSIVLSKKGQKAIADAIADAIEQYRLHRSGTKSFPHLSKCKVN